MINVLALLVSLAMMLTGAVAPVAEPVSRTLVLGNLTVQINDEEVKLSPYAQVGVTTDGEKAVYDMFVGGKDGETFLPFQLAADENGLLLLSDNSNVTIKLTKEELEQAMAQLEVNMDEADQAVFAQLGEFGTAYGDMLKLVGDSDAMKELQVKANAIYDEMIERGEGQPDKVVIDDETYDAMTYVYDVTGAQMGALTDAVMASDERLAAYAAAYFKLFDIMPEESGLREIDSYEDIFEKLGIDMTMHMVESIVEGGPTVTDGTIRISAEEIPQPLEFVVHAVKGEDAQTSTLTGEFTADDGMLLTFYMEAAMAGSDMTANMTFTANPTEADQEVAEAEAEEVEEVDEVESEDVDGEGDAEDAIFFTVDFEQSYSADTDVTSRVLSYTLDIADFEDVDAHGEFTIDGVSGGEAGSACTVSGSLDIDEQSFGFSFDANVNDAPIVERISEDKAVSVTEVDPTVLIAGVSADALKLYTDESVQKLVSVGKKAFENMMAVNDTDAQDDDGELEMLDGEGEIIEPDTDAGEQPAAEDLPYANPQFNWLPEGYAVENVNVEPEYRDVNCTISNSATGDSIFVDINESYNDGNVNHYIIREDGSYEAIDGVILNQDVSSDYSYYSMDDGSINISVFPSNPEVSAEDVIHMLTELTF